MPEQKEQKVSGGKKWMVLFIIVLVLFLALLIGLGWWYYTSNKPKTSPSPSALPGTATPTLKSSLTATPSPSASSSNQAATDDWLTFTNKSFNYSFKYPPNFKVIETDFITVESLKDKDSRPQIEIAHYDSVAYHPPEGTDVFTWMTKNFPMQYDVTDPNRDIKISGLPAIHLRNNATPQSYAADYYFFIKGSQLFDIMFLQKGEEDWPLNNKFLDNFTFN